MNHSFRLQKNTDAVDIENNCLGVSAWVIGDSTSKLNTNRGLHIQIRHNKNKDQFEAASQLSNLIAASPELLEALESAHEVLVNKIDQDRYFYRDKLIEKLWTAIQKAKGE